MSDTQCREAGSNVGAAVLCAWGKKDYTCCVSREHIIIKQSVQIINNIVFFREILVDHSRV